MRPRSRLWARLFASHLAVVMVAGVSLLLVVWLVAPSAFEAAMGHAMGGMAGMGEMMADFVRGAFGQALGVALVTSLAVAVLAAIVVSLALSTRFSRPIGRLAQASWRIAAGRYAERVEVSSDDEIGQLAGAFNTMAGSLEATERRRLQLVGDVAHELRTPLATLDGYLEGLEDGVVAPSDTTWALLRGETARLSQLVDDLQQLWRAEARQLALSPALLDVAEQLAAAQARFAKHAAERSVELRVEPGSAQQVRADPARLAQVLDNFLSNAIRHSPSNSRVSLSAGSRQGEVRISVSDQGPGLTEQQLEHVFERFYRADPSRSRTLGGSGIGLAIARALAEAMGGRVEAASEGPGRGSTFRLILPAS
jgi:signal transduction histidine kinase